MIFQDLYQILVFGVFLDTDATPAILRKRFASSSAPTVPMPPLLRRNTRKVSLGSNSITAAVPGPPSALSETSRWIKGKEATPWQRWHSAGGTAVFKRVVNMSLPSRYSSCAHSLRTSEIAWHASSL